MTNNYKTPGVYVKEISKLPPSVAQVETAIPAFIGFTEKAEKGGVGLVGKPTRIKSLNEYEDIFGSINPSRTNGTGTVTNIRIDVSVEIDGGVIKRIIPVLNSASTVFHMYHSLQFFFANGGGPCYVVSAETTDVVDLSNAAAIIEGAVDSLRYEDEPTLIVLPDAHLVTTDSDYYNMYNRSLVQSADLVDRFTIIDIKTPEAPNDDPVDVMRNAALRNLKYGAAYYPALKTTFNHPYDDESVNVSESVDGGALTPAAGFNAADLNLGDLEYNAVKEEIRKQIKVELPPSSAIAGIYARVDNDRGVWKAPANVTVSSVAQPTLKISDEDQKNLNVDTTAGKSVNAIRFFSGKGTLVWGARTLAGNDNEWRYVSVRRFYNMVEESVKKSSSWVVFEPNDARTWTKVKSMIVNYLTTLWRKGALAGPTPESAFFVKVGLGETMTSLDILEGRMNIEIGMAVVRPAEFIILKFSHKLQEA